MFALQQASYFDLDTFLDLESRLLQSLSEGSGDGPSPLLPSHLVLAFQAHSSWAEMLIQESKNDKKQKRRVYKMFEKYNVLLVRGVVEELTKSVKRKEISLKAALIILDSARYVHLQQRENLRVMRRFAIGCLGLLRQEVSTLEQGAGKGSLEAVRAELRREDKEDRKIELSEQLKDMELARFTLLRTYYENGLLFCLNDAEVDEFTGLFNE